MSKQPYSDMFARELHLAGVRGTSGLYKQVDSNRFIELDREGFLPANPDGTAVVSVLGRRSRNQVQGDGASSTHALEAMPVSNFCDVIGCCNEPCWVRLLSQDIYSEDYLCDHHREMLLCQDPNRASHYIPFSSLLKEGLSTQADVHGDDSVISLRTGEVARQISHDPIKSQ